MKTLADFKRALEKGTRWDVKHLRHDWVLLDRPVSKIKSIGVAFETVDHMGNIVHSWLYFPKAKDISFPDPDTAVISFDGVPTLQYTKAVK